MAVKMIEKCQISPPPASVPPTSLPLTFLDIPWFNVVPVKHLLFFEFTRNSNHFIDHVLPNFKHSLSIILHHFFPLAGYLAFPPLPAKPHLVYREGDSVPLTVAECSGDFNTISGNRARDVKEFLPLIAELPAPRESSGGSIVYPMLALQVTIFPNSGVCISITSRHMFDGPAYAHFLKSWVAVCNSEGDKSCPKNLLPFYDRSIIKDPNGILDIYLKQWYASKSVIQKGEIGSNNINNVRATFTMSGDDIEKMKLFILNQESYPLQLSTYSVASAFLWVCMQKMKNYLRKSLSHDDDEIKHLFFLADCRNRFEFKVPSTYFGNCLVMMHVKSKKSELLGENGVVLAARAIGKKVDQVKNEPMKGIENWITNIRGASEKLVVAGSPRFSFYEIDFGWGKPKKSEMAHIVDSGVVCLSDHRDDEDGIEIVVTLSKDEMHTFSNVFEQLMKSLSVSKPLIRPSL